MDNYKKEKSALDAIIREQCKRTGWTYNMLSYYLKSWDKLLLPKQSVECDYEYHKTTCEEYTEFLRDIKKEVNDIILTRFKTDIDFNSNVKLTECHLSTTLKDKYSNNRFNMLSKINLDYHQKMQMVERFKKVFGNINRSAIESRKYYKQQRQNLRMLKKQANDCEERAIEILPGGRLEINKVYSTKAKQLRKRINFLENGRKQK